MRAQLIASVAIVAGLGCKGARRPVAGPTCADAARTIAHGMIMLRADLATAEIDPAPEVAQLCGDDGWGPEVISCYAAADAPRELRGCSERLTSDQRLRARAVQEQLYRRASAVGDDASGGPTGIAACDEYLEVVAAFSACTSVSTPIKDAISESIAVMRGSWEQLGDDDTSRANAELGCNAASEALRQTMVSLGC